MESVPMWSLGRRVVALLLLTLLVSGCRLELRTALVLDTPGTGELLVDVGVDEELAEQLAAAGVDPFRGLDGVATPGWTASRAERGTVVQLRSDVGTTPLDVRVTALQTDLDTTSGRLVDELELRVLEDGGSELTGTIGATFPGVVGVTGDLAPRTADLVALADDAAYLYVFEVVTPTDILEHDADVNREGRLTWTVAAGETRSIRVLLAPPPPFTREQLLAAAGGLLLIASGLLVAARPRRQRR